MKSFILLSVFLLLFCITGVVAQTQDVFKSLPQDFETLKSLARTIDCSKYSVMVDSKASQEWNHVKACGSFKELIAGADPNALMVFGDAAFACPGPLDTLFLFGGVLNPPKAFIGKENFGSLTLLVFQDGITKGIVPTSGTWSAFSPDAPSTYKYHGDIPQFLRTKDIPNILIDVADDQITVAGEKQSPWLTIQRHTGRYAVTYPFLAKTQLNESGKCMIFQHKFDPAGKGAWVLF